MKTKRCFGLLLTLSITVFLCLFCGCSANSAISFPIQPTDPVLSSSPQEPIETQAFFWTWPTSETVNLDGFSELSELFDCIVDYYHTNWHLTQNECVLPTIKVFAQIDDTGEYYISLESIMLSVRDNDPLTLEISTGGGYFKVDTEVLDHGKVVTNMTKLSLDGNYEYTKEQLDKVPGLFEAYDNKNLVPLTYIKELPPLANLTFEYLSTYDFTYVDDGSGELQPFEEWLEEIRHGEIG